MLNTLTLLNQQGGDTLNISGNGMYSFVLNSPLGSDYALEAISNCTDKCTIDSATGTLDGNNIINIVCQPLAWEHPLNINDYVSPVGTQNDYFPKLSMNSNGETYMFFQGDHNGTIRYNYLAQRTSAGMWSFPTDSSQPFTLNSPNVSNEHSIVTSANQSAHAAWIQEDSFDDQQVYFAHYDGTSWAKPNNLSDFLSIPGSDATSLNLVSNSEGKTLLTWKQDIGGGNFQLFFAENFSGAWTQISNYSDAIPPAIVNVLSTTTDINEFGDAVILHTLSLDGGISYKTFLSLYDASTSSWLHPNDLNDEITALANVTSPIISLFDSGDILLVGLRNGSQAVDAYTFSKATNTWSSSNQISVNGNCTNLGMATSSSGDAIVHWKEANQLFYAHYKNQVWNLPNDANDFVSTATGGVFSSDAAMDKYGNFTLVWSQLGNANNDIYFAHYIKSSDTLHTPNDASDTISPAMSSGALAPHVTMGPQCQTVIAWSESDGSQNHIYMSEYK
ncbi:hypothetical protein MRY82_10080 [bacterium]|nr:hypothetical protein [bacterium]